MNNENQHRILLQLNNEVLMSTAAADSQIFSIVINCHILLYKFINFYLLFANFHGRNQERGSH